MLVRLQISNVVLIEKLELEFSNGLTVFSGETGAGKSVLLDSLGLVLGSKADVGLIRNGADKLSVVATFELKDQNSPFFKICADHELETDDEIIIKRFLFSDGKSKIFLNDQPISLKLLKELGSYLVEIHGQFDNQGLLNPSTHIDVLDAFGGYDDKLEKTKHSFLRYRQIEKQLKEAISSYEKNVQEEETLTHYKKELENMKVRAGEEKELTLKRTEMMQASKLIENLNEAYAAIQGEGLAGQIRHAMSAIDKINRITDGKYQTIADMLDSALIQLDESVGEIEKASEQISLDAKQVDSVEERLFALKGLARKHNCGMDDLPKVLEDITLKLALIEKNGDDIIQFKKDLCAAQEEYVQNAACLDECRQKAAADLCLKVQNELAFLKMGKAEFRIKIEKTEQNAWNEKGFNNVYMEAKTNAGQPFSALNKIASGGELARFMLALKVHLAQKHGIETLIFDEIDSGIGGATAEAVGNRLSRLSGDVQVMVVTHAPQVASFSTTHFKVSKEMVGNQTVTQVERLSDEQKKEEIARMLSGEQISEEARAAAGKLIEKSA